jgi:hypothetical protein
VTAGLWLVAAAALFWVSWLLMPGVGVTDAASILERVGPQRGSVLLSVWLQLASAACYAPALVGLAAHPRLGALRGVRGAATVLLVGAMGSAADAVFHLLAWAMTAPGLSGESLVPVMAAMQGPGLRVIGPLILAFFVGGAWLSIALARGGVVPRANPGLHALAVVVAVVGAALASGPAAARAAGLAVLALIAGAQAWIGLALWRAR